MYAAGKLLLIEIRKQHMSKRENDRQLSPFTPQNRLISHN